MKRVFAILHEPASYTLDRNHAVYDRMGIRYCYMHSSSLAKSIENREKTEALSSLSFIALAKRLNNILKDNDIIIMNGYTSRIFIVLYLLNFLYHRSIGLDSDTQLNIPNSTVKRFIKRLYLSTIFRNKHIFGLPGGTYTHKELFRHYGMNESRICLMPMVVNNSLFKNESQKKRASFSFLFVGRIVEVKNIELMIRTFIFEFENNSQVILKIVGDGELLNSLVEKYGYHSNIKFIGPKYGESLIDEYHNASAFILPSAYEPWGLVVNEAMSAGLPVIVSDQVGAAWDLVQNRNTGFIFRYNNPNELAEKMRHLVNDRKLYDKYSRSAYDLMHNYWNYEFYTDCLNKFIDKASSIK